MEKIFTRRREESRQVGGSRGLVKSVKSVARGLWNSKGPISLMRVDFGSRQTWVPFLRHMSLPHFPQRVDGGSNIKLLRVL